jgi:phage shock protein PspC (stress-responsive transcriptional regulator)
MATDGGSQNDHWFYVHSGAQTGPVGTSALRSLASTGQLKATDLVWRSGMNDWVLAARVKGLFPSSSLPAGSSLDERYSSFYCSSDEKKFLGLCGGLAHKFGLPLGATRFAAFLSMFVFIGWLYFVGLFLPKLPTKGVPRPA